MKQGNLSETELKAEFDKTWIDLVKDLQPVYNEPIDVEARVEAKLIQFNDKLANAVKKGLKKNVLREWGEGFSKGLVMKKKYISVKKNSNWAGRALNFVQGLIPTFTEPHLFEAQTITYKVFDEVRKYLESIKVLETYFSDALTLKLLEKVNKAIEDESAQYAENFTFTLDYRVKVNLTVCGYAVVQFEEMVENFRKKNDPKEHLEKYQRDLLLTKFKNQYYQTAHEKAFVDNICAVLRTPIVAQIESSLGAKVYGRIKHEAYFNNKTALKTKILIDLGTAQNFEKYMTYLTDTKQSLKDWIEHYTIEYCNKMESNESTHLQVLAKQEVSRMILLLQRKVDRIEDEDASTWLSTFCEDMEVRRELGARLNTDELLPKKELILDLINFKKQMNVAFGNLEKRLHNYFGKVKCNQKEMWKWQDKPYNLLKNVYGCTEQCPFCGEQCDLVEHSGTGVRHSVKQHRPQCTSGYHFVDTNILALEICPSNIAGTGTFMCKKTDFKKHSFASYHEIYPDWHIPCDPTAKDSMYWMWFVGKHVGSLASYYKLIPPKVPIQWTEIKWEDVMTKLEALYD